jgi:uncharacterized protein (TIGR03000 family)
VFGCGGGYGGSVAPAVAGYGAARSPYGMMEQVAPPGPAAAPIVPGGGAAAVGRGDVPAAPVAARPATQPAPVVSQVTVRLPAHARLYVNDDPCPLTSETRSFQTPQLKPDKEYSYTLRVEVERQGQTFSEIKKVTFKAGKAVNVEFKEIGTVRTVAR